MLTDRISTINISPQRDNPPHDSEEKAVIVSPALGDRLGAPSGRFDLFMQDVASRVMGMNYFEFQSSPDGQQFLKMEEYLSSLVNRITIIDDTGEFETLIQKGLAQATDALEQNMRQQLVVAHVQMPTQLRAKQQRIAHVKEIASREFYRSPEMIDKCVRTDLALTLSACGEASEQNRTTIQTYWSFISKSANGFQINEKVHSMAPKALLASLPDIMKQQEQTLLRMTSLNQAENIVAFFSKTLEKA
jgi:hypothetical protein